MKAFPMQRFCVSFTARKIRAEHKHHTNRKRMCGEAVRHGKSSMKIKSATCDVMHPNHVRHNYT